MNVRTDAVLIDEEAGRAAAIRLHLPFVGIAGILLRAKAAGLIPAVRPVLERLRTEAAFWMSPAFEEYVLRLAHEKP